MTYRALRAGLLLLCLTMPLPAGADAPIDWTSVRFDALDGTIGGFTIETVIGSLHGDAAREYTASYRSGDHWACIVRVLETCAAAERLLEGKDLSADPLEFMHQRSHSGRLWPFWLELARVGRAASSLGHPDVLQPAVHTVLSQMEDAFAPLLDRQSPRYAWYDEQ